jgi:histidinol phosphatase-like PHP family hydrolase
VTLQSPVNWRLRDCHAHSSWSDGELPLDALVAAVRARGVLPSVSDHVTRDSTRSLGSVDAVRAYLDAAEALSFPDLGVAGEFCWHDLLWRELPDDVMRRFTHRLGSLHAIPIPGGGLVSMFQGELPSHLTPDTYMDIHIATLERFAAEMPVDILSHPTLLPMPLRALDATELWTESREERMVAALRRANIAFEISNRYRAHERLVRRAYDSGVRLSLGSDGHTREGVGDLAWPLAMARACGVSETDLYDPVAENQKVESRK